ncbi:YtzI protein [Bacillus sp. 2205SS5-2]|uniref:YtzI protein n=1 Tax=Bacillus sp. 2205SS5-2 TaxID=3109031 RepID=UPI00300500E9
MVYTLVIIISIVIILLVIGISALTTSKAYSYKHTIDPVQENSYDKNAEHDSNNADKQTK